MSRKAYNWGNQFAPAIDTEFLKTESGWVGSVTIGGDYYESDPYKEKSYAESEILGYLEGLEAKIEGEIDGLRSNINVIK